MQTSPSSWHPKLQADSGESQKFFIVANGDLVRSISNRDRVLLCSKLSIVSDRHFQKPDSREILKSSLATQIATYNN